MYTCVPTTCNIFWKCCLLILKRFRCLWLLLLLLSSNLQQQQRGRMYIYTQNGLNNKHNNNNHISVIESQHRNFSHPCNSIFWLVEISAHSALSLQMYSKCALIERCGSSFSLSPSHSLDPRAVRERSVCECVQECLWINYTFAFAQFAIIIMGFYY